MKDIHALNEPRFTAEKFFKQLCGKVTSYQKPNKGQLKYSGFSHYTLSGASVVGTRYGISSAACVERRFTMLKNYIERNKLGTIMITEPVPSPTYGGSHMITAGLYTPDNRALVAFGRKHGWIPKKWKEQWAMGTYG